MWFIYETTNLINGKSYVGQHKGSPSDGYLGSGVALKAAIKKYGRENFERQILEEVTEENVNEREIYYIQKRKSEGKAEYNIALGGQPTLNPFAYLSEERVTQIKEKMSKSRKGKISGSAYHTWELKSPHKTGVSQRDKIPVKCLTDGLEFESMSSAAEYYDIDLSSLSKVCLGKRKTVAGKQFEFINEKHDCSFEKIKKVRCGNKIFNSVREAAKFYNIDSSSITKVCKGKRRSVGGLIFEYA